LFHQKGLDVRTDLLRIYAGRPRLGTTNLDTVTRLRAMEFDPGMINNRPSDKSPNMIVSLWIDPRYILQERKETAPRLPR
jgi:hypothetical protein